MTRDGARAWRRWTPHATFGELALVVVAAGLLVGGGPVPDAVPAGTSEPAGSYRVAPSCPRAPRGVGGLTVDMLNRLVSSTDLPGWQAADIGASARLSDGRVVWVFGDTVREATLTPRLVANSMLVSSGTCMAQVSAPDDGPVIPDAAPGVVLWPMSVVAIEPTPAYAGRGVDDVVVVLCTRTRRGTEPMDFHNLGTSAAVFTVSAGQAPQLRSVVELTGDSAARDRVDWGAASAVDGAWFYIFGTRWDTRSFGRELYVGRSPAANPADRRRWRFWDGTRWQRRADRAHPVLPARGGVSQTLSVDRVDGRWLAVSKRDGDLGDYVYTWDAPTPHGPWTARRAIAAPAGFDTGRLQYAPLAHPELPLANGKLLVSISRNTTDLERLLRRPEAGRPVFAEVERP